MTAFSSSFPHLQPVGLDPDDGPHDDGQVLVELAGASSEADLRGESLHQVVRDDEADGLLGALRRVPRDSLETEIVRT